MATVLIGSAGRAAQIIRFGGGLCEHAGVRPVRRVCWSRMPETGPAGRRAAACQLPCGGYFAVHAAEAFCRSYDGPGARPEPVRGYVQMEE